MTIAYLGIGSNLRSPIRQLNLAIKQLRQLPGTQLLNYASFYHNDAWGRKGQPSFYNSVIEIQTHLTALRLLAYCNEIEQKQGRLRLIKWAARTLDIDILLYGQVSINTLKLKIPHPGLIERDFFYKPLLEIAPQVRLPNGKKLSTLISTHHA